QQVVEAVAGGAPPGTRPALTDAFAMLLADAERLAVQAALQRVSLGTVESLLHRQLLQAGLRAVGQQYIAGDDVVGGHAVADRVRPGGIVARHAAQRGTVRRGWVWAKHESVGGGGFVEGIEDDAGLHPGGALCRV